ncbi:unnamed protein product, partial [Adineta ricciae]
MSWQGDQNEDRLIDTITATISAASTTVPYRIYTDLQLLCSHLCQLPPYLQKKQRTWLGHMDFNILSKVHVDPLSTLLTSRAIGQILSAQSVVDATGRQEAEFMYALLSRDVLIDIESTEEEIIRYFRQNCADNDADINTIDEFEAYYDPINAIFWYTRDTFLYRLLNKALREQTIDTLYSLRYFIKDLHLQLRERHNKQQQLARAATPITNDNMTTTERNNQQIMTVYRGQLMNNSEFDRKIRCNTNGFFSVSNFFSTTIHENLAREVYAGTRSSSETTEEQSVLFRIDIDRHVNKFPYAILTSESAFDAVEGEVLFTMGSVFKILSVLISENGGYWNVQLKLTDDEDKELQALTEFIKSDIIQPNPLESLARLLIEMGSNKKAEHYYLKLFDDPTFTSNSINLISLYNNLGSVYQAMSHYEKAIEFFEKALEIKSKYSPDTDRFVAILYSNLGSIYNDQGKYDKAYRYYGKALQAELDMINPNQRDIATYYSNIGNVCNTRKQYTEAIEMLEKSVEI